MQAVKFLHSGIILAALVAASSPGWAQAPAPPAGGAPGFGEHRPPMERMLGGSHGRWWNDPAVVDRLKLSEDQRKSMDDILQQHRESLIDMRANVEKAEVALEPLMGADQPNESAILAQIDRVAQARAELEKANARFLLDLRGKLTPDQWKGLQAMRSERQAAGPGMRHWHNAPPAGPAPQAAPAPPDGGPQSLIDDIPSLTRSDDLDPSNR